MRKSATTAPAHDHEHDYSALLETVTAHFKASTDGVGAVFKTDADGLFEAYLDALPAERQVHNCNCCRKFIETYGSLVCITDDGEKQPIMWGGDMPGFYQPAFARLAHLVKKAKVTGVFLTKEAVWGTPQTGSWSHLSIVAPRALVYREGALTPGQAMAAHKESARTIFDALGSIKAAHLDQALQLLKGDFLARAEKFVAPVQWLRDLHDNPNGPRGYNLLHRAVALAPEGYLHPRAAVTGSLLEDLAAGLPFEDIKRKFDAKLGPLIYQRPQAAPSAGNIKAAEALVEKLGLEPSLHRRYARIDELPLKWAPKAAAEAPKVEGKVFGHLKAKGDEEPAALNTPATTMTWEKFARVVLPGAEQIEILVPHVGRFTALTTAENADAPPILKWDRQDARNPVAWYTYPRGSQAANWGLESLSFAKISGIADFPNLYGATPMPYVSEGVLLLIEGAMDRQTGQGNALFPEMLKEDLHGIRATVEAYSKSAILGGREEGSACGYDIRKSGADCQLRVFSGGVWQRFNVDRWD